MSITIIGAGGTGTNIAKLLEPSFEKGQVVYADTSKANVREGISDDIGFFIEGKDGSGGIRGENVDAIRKSVKPFLLKFPVEETAIIIFSTSSGTGSVFGPLLINALMEEGKNVIALPVISTESHTACKNTLKTFETLKAIQSKQNKPLLMICESNDKHGSLSEVNELHYNNVISLMGLLSVPHNHLDRQDIKSWFDYTRVCDIPPTLATVAIAQTPEALAELTMTPVTVLSLFNQEGRKFDSAIQKNLVRHQKSGFVNGEIEIGKDISLAVNELHYVVELDRISYIEEFIEHRIAELAKISSAQTVRKSTFSIEGADDDGLVI